MAFCPKCGQPVEGAFCGSCGASMGASAGAGSAGAGSAGAGSAGAPPPPAMQPAAPVVEKKKGGALKFVLFGCLGLLLLGAIGVIGTSWWIARKVKQAGFDPELMQQNPGLAAAKMAIAVNPDLETVEVNEARGIIRVRQKSTGKLLELDFERAKEGKIVFREDGKEVSISGEGGQVKVETPEGSGTFGGASEGPDWLPAYSGAQGQASIKQGEHGSYTFKTDDTVDQAVSFYEREMGAKGYQVKRTASFTEGTTAMHRLTATGEGRTVQLNIVSAGAGTTVTVSW